MLDLHPHPLGLRLCALKENRHSAAPERQRGGSHSAALPSLENGSTWISGAVAWPVVPVGPPSLRHTHTHMIHLCALQLVYSDLEALGFRDEATLEDGILL